MNKVQLQNKEKFPVLCLAFGHSDLRTWTTNQLRKKFEPPRDLKQLLACITICCLVAGRMVGGCFLLDMSLFKSLAGALLFMKVMYGSLQSDMIIQLV